MSRTGPWTIFGLVVVIGFAISRCIPEAKPPAPEEIAAKAAEEAKCKTDLQCYGEKVIGLAGYYCQKPIEQRAMFDFKWTVEKGYLGFRDIFDRWNWQDDAHTKIIFWGDKLMIQNKYGAFENQVYGCTFNPETSEVIFADAYPGRLPEQK